MPHSSDVDPEARFGDHGLEVTRFTGPDMRDVGLVTARIRSAYRRAHRLPSVRRAWTLEPPAWWRAA